MLEQKALLDRPSGQNRLRPWLLAGIGLLIIAQIVVLTPANLEEADSGTPSAVDPRSLFASSSGALAPGIPKDRIADYTIEQFNYVSTQGNEKLWRLLADQTFLYTQEDLAHSKAVRAFLFDSEGNTTLVTGKESKYLMHGRDLEVFGDVKVTLPDGFKLESPYLRYRTDLRRIEIPENFPVQGASAADKASEELIHFQSHGLESDMKTGWITLPKAVVLIAENTENPKDRTRIESDRCVIERFRRIAHFTMSPARELSSRFVYITQPELYSRSRSADLMYGDRSKLMNSLVALGDVLIKETGKGRSLRYGTGGRADFDSHRNVIRLSEFPQVYQGQDTVTGEVILVHRDSDVVEVEHSNAFSEGTEQD